MSVPFWDIKQNVDLKRELEESRIPGATFDELLYADDTILISTNPKAINKFIKEIEIQGELIGMKLNKDKTEIIILGKNKNVNIRFRDGTSVKKVTEARYLGVELNERADPNKELRLRISNTMSTWKKMGVFFKNANCTVRFKIQVYHAVIRAKLMYGLESAQFNNTTKMKLDVFYLKGLRHICKIQTTWTGTEVIRENTNEEVYRIAMEQARQRGKKEMKLIPLSEWYDRRKWKD